MDPLTAVVAVVLVFAGLTALIAWADGLTFLAPKSTHAIRNLSTTMGHSTGLIREQCPVW